MEARQESAGGLRERLSTAAPVWLALVLAATGLLLGLALKGQCALNPWADNFQYKRLCYNDIQPLFSIRGVDLGLLPYRDVRMEYPVLTGVFMYVTGRLLAALSSLGVASLSDPDYFWLSALLLTPFGVAVTMLLRKHVRTDRLILWAVGTTTIFYAFQNWDLIAVAFATAGMVAFERGWPDHGGVSLAAGATAKMYPGFIAPGVVLARLRRGGVRAAWKAAAAAAGAYLLLNLPWALASNGTSPVFRRPDWVEIARTVPLRKPEENGWLAMWTFHADRYPDFGTGWFWLAHHMRVLAPSFPRTGYSEQGAAGYRDFVNVVSAVLFIAGTLLILWLSWRRGRADGSAAFPVAAAGLAIVCLFMLVTKVNSTQYALWLIPFFALLNIPWRLIGFYLVTDALAYVSSFRWYMQFAEPAPAIKGVFEAAVLLRLIALACLLSAALKAERLHPNISSRPSMISSRPES